MSSANTETLGVSLGPPSSCEAPQVQPALVCESSALTEALEESLGSCPNLDVASQIQLLTKMMESNLAIAQQIVGIG